MRVYATAMAASLVLARPTSAQAISRVFGTAAIGVGATAGADTLYQASPATTLRVGLGLRVGRREIEISAIHEDYLDVVLHPSDYACLPGGPCRVNYRFDGVSAGMRVDASDREAPFGLQAGAGIYRLVAQHPYRRALSDASCLGLHLDAEVRIAQAERLTVLLGVRPIMFMNVHDTRPWALPIELRFRTR